MSNIIGRVVSSAMESGARIVKLLLLGEKDVRTAEPIAPWGIDSQAVKDAPAIYADTMSHEDAVILGYANPKQLAGDGELRIYSTDGDAETKIYIWLKSDGTMLVGGDADNMVRYSKLAEAFNELKQDFNSLVSTFNSHTHPYVDSGSPSTTSPSTSPGTSSAADISPAKIEEIKTT